MIQKAACKVSGIALQKETKMKNCDYEFSLVSHIISKQKINK